MHSQPTPSPNIRMNEIRRIEVLSVPVDVVDMVGALEKAEEFIASKRTHSILAVNPEKVMLSQRDGAILNILRSSDLLLPDGIGLVLAAKFSGLGNFSRVAGADFMQNLLKLASERGYRTFFYGAEPEVNEQAVQILEKQYHGLIVAGREHGYVKPGQFDTLIQKINDSNADILFVALGSPKQEKWIHRYKDRLNVKICMGIGGTLDVLCGRSPRAPGYWQRLNLEWLYRLLKEPERLRRQKVLPRFAWCILKAKLTLKS